MKKWFSLFLVALVLVVLVVILSNYLVSSHSRAFVTNDIHAVDQTNRQGPLGIHQIWRTVGSARRSR